MPRDSSEIAAELVEAGQAWDAAFEKERRYDASFTGVDVTNRKEDLVHEAAAALGVSTFELSKALQSRRFAGDDWPTAVGYVLDA